MVYKKKRSILFNEGSDCLKIDVLDIPLNYEEYGSGKNIILLHGWGTSLKSFENVIDHLSNNYHVWAIDWPGFGNSDEPPRSYGIIDYMAVLRKFITLKEIDNPIIVGHSFGGRVAIKYASSFDVEKMVLVDSAGIKPKRNLWYYIRIYLFKLLKLLHIKLNLGSVDYKASSNLMKGTLSKVVNEDLKTDMESIRCPTLLIWGENDLVTEISDGKTMEGIIKNSGLAIIPSSGHYPFLDNPAYFLLVLDSFLSSDET